MLSFVLGVSIGSFCNVCIYRLPRGLSVMTGRSFCPCCRANLRWFELIPLLSFITIGGKCLRCRSRISFQYPVVEALAGFIVVFGLGDRGFTSDSLALTFFLLSMLVVVFVDWQRLVIPNSLLAYSFVAGIILSAAPNLSVSPALGLTIFSSLLSASSIQTVSSSLLSSVFCFAVMALILFGGNRLFRKETMGAGDVKLAAVIGLYIGWELFLVALWAAALVGTLYGLTMILLFRRSISMKVPFGSFLAGSAGAAAVFAPGVP